MELSALSLHASDSPSHIHQTTQGKFRTDKSLEEKKGQRTSCA